MLILYVLAIFLSAALLFLVQPMAAKLVLPLLGGTPPVWTTCMLFFQILPARRVSLADERGNHLETGAARPASPAVDR
ncbi:MAG: hypothetical protein IT435_13760 [Phycisphaerales bacterium]|nr:hypothetical protein [Phycisphaerales bacterium]